MKTAKVIIIGDSFVGKTSLRAQFLHHSFSTAYRASIGADFLSTRVDTPLGAVYLQIWDTAGQEKFNALGHSFYRGADVCVLVYDVTSTASFAHLDNWLQVFLNHSGLPPAMLPPSYAQQVEAAKSRRMRNTATTSTSAVGDSDRPPVPLPIIVVGNKIDQTGSKTVMLRQVQEWAKGKLAVGDEDVFEVSAKMAITVEEAFQQVAMISLERAETDARLVSESFEVDSGANNRVDITSRHRGLSSCCPI